MVDYKKQLALDLYNSGCIKFQTVTLKSGKLSPLYVDLRVLVTYPSIIQNISQLLLNNLMKQLNYEVICGVPYTG